MSLQVEQLELCNSISRTINELSRSVKDLSKPYLTDLTLIEPIHKYLQEQLAGKPYNISCRVELMILLYLFSPMLIVSRKHESNCAFGEIAKVMGIQNSNLSKYKTTILPYYKTYRDFRELTDMIYDDVVKKIAENTLFENQ